MFYCHNPRLKGEIPWGLERFLEVFHSPENPTDFKAFGESQFLKASEKRSRAFEVSDSFIRNFVAGSCEKKRGRFAHVW